MPAPLPRAQSAAAGQRVRSRPNETANRAIDARRCRAHRDSSCRPGSYCGCPVRRVGDADGRSAFRRSDGRPGRIPSGRERLHLMSQRPRQAGLRRRHGDQTALWNDLWKQHYARREVRHRQLERRRLHRGDASGHRQGRPSPLSRVPLYELYAHACRGCPRHQGISLRAKTRPDSVAQEHGRVSLQPDVGDRVLESTLQSESALRAGFQPLGTAQSRGVSRGRSRALRTLSYADELCVQPGKR